MYPINLKKVNPNKNLKIVFMSTINVNCNKNESNIWEKYRNEILNNFSIIDNKDFWLKITNERDNVEINKLYRKIKLLLRFEIIQHLKKNIKKNLIYLVMTGTSILKTHSDQIITLEIILIDTKGIYV